MLKIITVNEVNYEIKVMEQGTVYCNGMSFISEEFLVKYIKEKGK